MVGGTQRRYYGKRGRVNPVTLRRRAENKKRNIQRSKSFTTKTHLQTDPSVDDFLDHLDSEKHIRYLNYEDDDEYYLQLLHEEESRLEEEEWYDEYDKPQLEQKMQREREHHRRNEEMSQCIQDARRRYSEATEAMNQASQALDNVQREYDESMGMECGCYSDHLHYVF